ncbi:hypothetical protein GF362_04755 [Candidatus Dojkabacteria bacterium]|nr:hypothetical protein [Candidatus Dojkabacteria bacterium]
MTAEQLTSLQSLRYETVVPVNSNNYNVPIAGTFSTAPSYAFIIPETEGSVRIRFEDNPWYNTPQSYGVWTGWGWDSRRGASPESAEFLVRRGNIAKVITSSIGPLVADLLLRSGTEIEYVPWDTTLGDLLEEVEYCEEESDTKNVITFLKLYPC